MTSLFPQQCLRLILQGFQAVSGITGQFIYNTVELQKSGKLDVSSDMKSLLDSFLQSSKVDAMLLLQPFSKESKFHKWEHYP